MVKLSCPDTVIDVSVHMSQILAHMYRNINDCA